MAEPAPRFNPDYHRLALVEAALLLLAIGLVLLVKAQIFTIHVQGSLTKEDHLAYQFTFIVGLGVLMLGAVLFSMSLSNRLKFNPSTVWAVVGLIIALFLLAYGLVPLPSWKLGAASDEQIFDVLNQPSLFKQERWFNSMAAVTYTFACLNLIFLSVHELVAPEGSTLLPKEGVTPGRVGPLSRGQAEMSPPLLKCSHCTRRFVATSGSNRCPSCGKTVE